MLDRILLVNTVVLPRLLYRLECLPITEPQLLQLSSTIEKFVTGGLGLPTLVATKTMYTHRSHGLGLGHLPILYPSRVLDSLHTNKSLREFSTSPPHPMAPYALFLGAVSLLGPPPPYAPQQAVTLLWEASSVQRDASAVMTIAGLRERFRTARAQRQLLR